MADRIPMTYGEFYDFPRMIRFQFGGEWFFLDAPLDEERDDYPDVYDVYLLPFRSEEEIKANPFYWKDLSSAVHLGQIGVTEIGLDETRRRSLDAGVIGLWLSARSDPRSGAG
jgi:hypothetical protein